MPGPQGDIGALVLAHQLLDAILFHQRRALHHDPVLSAVVMHLQGEAGAGIDHDLLHLPALPFGDAVVGAPGPVDLAMGLALRSALPFQGVHHRLDILGPIAMGHQHHVIGFNHHQILHTQAHHQPVFTAEIAVTGPLTDHPSPEHIAVGVLVGGLPQGAPAAHVTPARGQGQHGTPVGALHDGHVEGHIGAVGKGLALQTPKLQVGALVFQGTATGAHHLGRQTLQLRQDGAGTEQEHATVPGEAPTGQKLFGRGAIGLLHEAPDGHRRRCGRGIEGLRRLDIAVARFRSGGHDPEGDQLAGGGGGNGRLNGGPEPFSPLDHMVSGEHQQQGIVSSGAGLQGRHGHGRRRVPPHGFQQDGRRLHADLPHLLGHNEAMVLVADQ